MGKRNINKSHNFYSIIIPVYNSENVIEKAVNSVINQKYKNWELIIINDGSTDNTLKIINKYSSSKIKIIDKANSGVSETRNYGILQAHGDWVVFLDADDTLECDALQSYENIHNNCSVDIDLIVANYIERKGDNNISLFNGNITKSFICNNKNDVIKSLITYFFCEKKKNMGNLRTVWAKAFKKDIIDHNSIVFDKDVKIGEDMLFLLQYITKCNTIYFSDNIVYDYYINSCSVTNNIVWNGNDQGIKYFNKTEDIVANNVEEQEKQILWFEIFDREMRSILRSDASLLYKHRVIKNLCKTDLYQRFISQNKLKSGTMKMKLYKKFMKYKAFWILILIWYMVESN